MTNSQQMIEVSYEACRRICRQAGSNFVASFLLLPRPKRRAMRALYAFMRHTDDLADNPDPLPARTEALARWRTALDRALSDDLEPADDERAILPALADTVRQFRIPTEHLHAVIDGVGMDLCRRRYETVAELEGYCRRVASAVGLACVHVWGFRGPEAFEPAEKCGLAMQWTNILRDIKEDAAADRVYLPLEDLRQCDYTVDDLRAGVADERFDRLMAMQLDRAEQYYRQAEALFDWLDPQGRRVFGLMLTTYRALLAKIRRRPRDVLRKRIRLSRLKKLQLAARSFLKP